MYNDPKKPVNDTDSMLFGRYSALHRNDELLFETFKGFNKTMQTTNSWEDLAKGHEEKEVRRARKEAFKSSSDLFKSQEESKTARNKYTLIKKESEAQRRRAAEKEKEAFTA